jgi:hypothetical protein
MLSLGGGHQLPMLACSRQDALDLEPAPGEHGFRRVGTAYQFADLPWRSERRHNRFILRNRSTIPCAAHDSMIVLSESEDDI